MPPDEATSLFPETAPLMVSACQATRFPLHSTGNLHPALSPATASTYCRANMGKANLSWWVGGGCWCWGQAREAEGLQRGRRSPTLTPVLTQAHLPGATKPLLTPVPTHTQLSRAAKRLLKPLLPLDILVMPLQVQQPRAGDCTVCLQQTKLLQHESETQLSHKSSSGKPQQHLPSCHFTSCQ